MRHVFVVAAALMATSPAWADFQAGLDAARMGDYATAYKEWKSSQATILGEGLLRAYSPPLFGSGIATVLSYPQ